MAFTDPSISSISRGFINEMGIKPNAVRRTDALKAQFEHKGWRFHFNDIANFMQTRRNVFLKNANYNPNEGFKKNENINNAVAEAAIVEAGAGMMHGFTSPSQPWLQIIPADLNLAKFKPVREYLYRQQQRMYSIFESSNLYDTLPMVYQELNAFGNAAMRVDFDQENTIHCTQHTIGSYYFANGRKDQVDTVPHQFVRTVRQLVQEYGLQGVSKNTRKAFEDKNLDEWVICWNLVEVNDDQDRNMLDFRGMPWRSITWEQGSADDEVLKIRGFDQFPTMTPRGRRISDDAYASSNGMTALPDVRELQRLEMRKKQALSQMVKPTMNTWTGKAPTTVAGEFNRMREGQTPTSPAFTVTMPYDIVMNEVAKHEVSIRDYLNANLFTMFKDLDASGRRGMTATEVAERRAELLSKIGPMQQSIHNGLLRPLVQLTWFYMGQNGQLEPPPPELAGIPLKIEFTSQLALAQSGVRRNDTEAFLDRTALIDQAFPGAADNIDSDLAIRTLGEGYLIDPAILRDPDQVQEMRQQQADLLAQQQQQQAELDQTQGLKNLGGASTSPDSALGALTG